MSRFAARLVPEFVKSHLRDFPLVPPWSTLLPGTSASFGPPRRWARVADYLRGTGEPSWEVEPAEEIRCPSPQLFGPDTVKFEPYGPIVIPARTVFQAKDIAILGPDSHLVGRRDTLLWDAAWHSANANPRREFRNRSTISRKTARSRRHLRGLTAALGSDWAIGSFGHFIYDALLRWRLLQAAGFRAEDFKHFVLFHPDSTSARWFIEAAGIPLDRVVSYDPACDLACEEIIGTTLGNNPPAHARSTMKWLRELALGAGVEPHERVYLSRAGYRRHPTNAVELETELGRRGFFQVRSDDGMTANRACLAARVIVGVEGTNLASAGFAPRGAIVIILLPQAGALPVYPFIFEACGHTTAVVSMQAGSTMDAPAFALDALRAALDWAGV